ncbi:hypothetical protein COJ38_21885 [Bacillus cereus]|uniref:hypothetical protein n=1 Tax=Bacillus cereus group TaxID=86661 RepID=UPI000BECE947|nr:MULTISPECIES: hypothetical protein [Bacillus cereus group]MEB9862142.1 hypothetical protein [Bacillus cereus]PEB69601.1 hypothetical protein COM91_12480 [Bacillus thuringiensis]PFC05204.1 hypothetical protein CN280_16760 [Bacillus cereus]PFL86172.1 hypothetical protein COJ38_21885 [Bacillus cereus]PFN79001.1 hypothetical protein COJ64_04275 [Bacillus cereus]
MNLTRKQSLVTVVTGIILFFVITFFTIFTIVSELTYDHPDILIYSFTKTLVWFFYLFVLVTIITFIIALVKLKNKKAIKKTFIVTGLTFLVSISLFFGLGLIASNLQKVESTTASKTFTEEEVDRIISDNTKKEKELNDKIKELEEFKDNKNYYDKLKSYNALKQYMTYDEVVAAFDGDKGAGTPENIENKKNKTFIWDLYTEEVICRFSYDVFKEEFVLTSFLKQKKPNIKKH